MIILALLVAVVIFALLGFFTAAKWLVIVACVCLVCSLVVAISDRHHREL